MYYEIVKRPMDFGTIIYNLNSKTHYPGPDEVLADVEQVCTLFFLFESSPDLPARKNAF